MSRKSLIRFTVLLTALCNVQVVLAQICQDSLIHTPEDCFSIEDIEDYAATSSSLEALYNDYVNLLTKARLTIDGDEPGVNLFFGGELPEQIRKLKYYGNSIITFLEIAFHHASREFGLNGEQLLYCIKQLNITADYFEICEHYDQIDCAERNTTYQPIDGACVNYDNPYLGAINTPYRRILKNSFDDSIHEVRSSAHDNELPSARLISTGLRTLYIPLNFESNENLQNDFLLFFMKQIIFDVAKTLKSQTWDGNYGFECCSANGKSKISQRFSNHHCLPIDVPARDTVIRGVKCMNYIRAMVSHDNCKLQESSVLNAATHFLDMDFLYVSANVEIAISNNAKFSENENDIHRTIVYGDERVFQTPQMNALSIVWIKFHNVVVDELRKLHPSLSNEIIFYEARRFVIAVYQSIFYTEVLPLIVSPKSLARYRLANIKPCYNADVDPSVTAEFVASVGRVFHTFIHNDYIVNFKNGTSSRILLRNLNNESLAYNELNGVISGLLERPWNNDDIANEPSNFLFTANSGPGLDLRAFDIQAERDFGIGTYCDALYFFNVTDGECIKKFSDFMPFISDNNIEFLKYAYEHPCDVDFGVGGLMHSADEGDLLSEIFDRVIGIQFKHLKCGDPYFYSNALQQEQLDLVNSITYKDVLCFSLPNFPPIQPFVFLTPGENNTKEACSGKLDLESWTLLADVPSPSYHDE